MHLGKRKLKSSMVGVAVFPALIFEKKILHKESQEAANIKVAYIGWVQLVHLFFEAIES